MYIMVCGKKYVYTLEWPLDPFLVRESDRKLNFIRLKHLHLKQLHVRFFRVVMACVFEPLLPGVCLYASCHTPFLDPIVLFLFYLFIFRITSLFSLLFASKGILRVEVLGLSHLNFGTIIYFCEAEHPLGLLTEAPVHN